MTVHPSPDCARCAAGGHDAAGSDRTCWQI